MADPPTNGNVIEANAEQALNAPSPILVTLLGIEIEVKLMQFLNAQLKIEVKLDVGSNVTLAKFEQLPKA